MNTIEISEKRKILLAELKELCVKEDPTCSGPGTVYVNHLMKYQNKKTESFFVLLLDGQNRVVSCKEVTRGIVNKSLVHPRETFRAAIAANSCSIIIAHNHPSGNTNPSKKDHEVTRKLKSAGEILGIPVIDHIIIGKYGYFSFLENGCL